MRFPKKTAILLLSALIITLTLSTPPAQKSEVPKLNSQLTFQTQFTTPEEVTSIYQTLSNHEIDTLILSGQRVVKLQRQMLRSNNNLFREIADGFTLTKKFEHYPVSDVYDPKSRYQYFYHAHREGEHGHFHIFYRTPQDEFIQLLAISISSQGLPQALFTTNQWVTNEIIAPANEVKKLAEGFTIDISDPSYLTNTYLKELITFFKPHISLILEKRDLALDHLISLHGKEVLKNQNIDLLSEVPVDINEQLIRLKEIRDSRKKSVM